MAQTTLTKSSNGAPLGFEKECWKMADKLRSNMDPGEYKHVVLGLIFLKYISDSFQECYDRLEKEFSNPKHESFIPDPKQRQQALEDMDEYRAQNIFWVPPGSRWAALQANATQPTIGTMVDDAMIAIERDNPSLKGVLPKEYGRSSLDKTALGGLINLVARIPLVDKKRKARDLLGGVYEYFLGEFASAEGKRGGQFYTPKCVVQTLVEMLSPFNGRVYDPCCGSGGMFVQSEEFIIQHRGKIDAISVYGQESNPTTWRLAKMNLAIHGIDNDLGKEHADSFHRDLHPDLKADYILANPPFNMSDWGGERLREDARWKFGIPPVGNANYAWVQHFIHHLAPTGLAGFVLANGSMSSNTSGEGEIRKNIIDADLVDCMVALPGQLFTSTQIPACLWFIAHDKTNHRFKDRRRKILFIDARKMGAMRDRVHRDLTDADIQKISDTYHAWRGDEGAGAYEDMPGFCKSASLEEVRENGHLLTPGRYVGAEAVEDDGVLFEEKMQTLTTILNSQFEDSQKLERDIKEKLRSLEY